MRKHVSELDILKLSKNGNCAVSHARKGNTNVKRISESSQKKIAHRKLLKKQKITRS